MELTTAYSLWYLIPALLTGLGYALLLYYKSRGTSEIPTWLKKLLFGIRFTVISLICFLLLKPVIRWFYNDIRKPIILIAQDNSASLATGSDSIFLYRSWPEKVRELMASFGDDYIVKTLSFDKDVRDSLQFSYDGLKTDYSRLIEDVATRYDNRNLGAVVLASDGRYNAGKDPVSDAVKLKVPVYTIALGDTVVHKDILIREALHNKLAYQGNSFPVRITVQSAMCKGAATALVIRHLGHEIQREPLSIKNNNEIIERHVMLPADSAGIQRYDIIIRAIDDEYNKENNRKSIFIKVIDSRQKILLLCAAPHPDVAAIRRAIASRISYHIDVETLRSFNNPLRPYNMIIWYQLPGINNGAVNLIQKADELDIPQLFILGNRSDLPAFNKLNAGLNITVKRAASPNEVVPAFNEAFNLFTVDESGRALLRKAPPLHAPFGRYHMATGARVLCYQQIGALTTDQPLIYLLNKGQYRLGVICGEGLWRWRLYDYNITQSQDHFDNLIRHLVQYLASKGSGERLFIDAKQNYINGEPLIFHATVYDKAYEPVKDAEIKMLIKDSTGHQFPFRFPGVNSSYRLNAGFFEPGIYTYNATCNNGDELLTSSGSFVVIRQDIEQLETLADHHQLYRLSSATGGKMLYPEQLNQVAALIKNREDISSFNYRTKKMLSIIYFKWLCGLIILLLSVEWFVRKRHGAY